MKLFEKCHMVVKHFNKNKGAYDVLLAIVIAIIAVVSYFNSLSPPPVKPDIEAYQVGDAVERLTDTLLYDTILVVYNKGNAPCFRLKLVDNGYISYLHRLSDDRLINKERIITNISYVPLIGLCTGVLDEEVPQTCTYDIGYVRPNEIIPLGVDIAINEFYRGEDEFRALKKKVAFNFECLGDKDSVGVIFSHG